MRLRRSLAPAAAALLALTCAREPAPTTAQRPEGATPADPRPPNGPPVASGPPRAEAGAAPPASVGAPAPAPAPAPAASSAAGAAARAEPPPGRVAEPAAPGSAAAAAPGRSAAVPAPAAGEAADPARAAGSPQALAATAAPAGAAAGAPAPGAARSLEVTALKVVVRGAPGAPLARDGSTRVDPAAAFELEVAAALADGRFALHDGSDAMVPSTGETELGDRTSRFKLTPVAPLRPGSAYTLVLDGASSREVHDTSGGAYVALTVPFKTAGDPPPAPPRKAKRHRR